MKSLAIAAFLALAGFASLAAPASADHFNRNGYGSGYRGGPAACAPGYGGGFGQWSQGPLRPQLNLSRGSSWNNRGGHGHNHGHNHNHGQGQRRGNDGGFYFGNRDFSLGIRF